jgi:hypothetical protein
MIAGDFAKFDKLACGMPHRTALAGHRLPRPDEKEQERGITP